MLGDAHVYNIHVEPLHEQLQNIPKPFPVCLSSASLLSSLVSGDHHLAWIYWFFSMPNRAIVHAYQMRLYKLICAYEILIGLVNLWGKASVNPCVEYMHTLTWHIMKFQLTEILNVLWIFIGSVCKSKL